METSKIVISRNLKSIRERIHRSASACNQDASHIKLVVVSKLQSIEVVQAAIDAGVLVFGENYPEEAVSKITAFQNNSEIEWHMIGHLQSRKARLVAEHFSMMQSLDSLHLAEKLDRILDEMQKTLPVLLEFNVSGEESKFGWPAWEQEHWEDLLPDVSKILNLSHLKVRGLMTMPPLTERPDEVRPYFNKLNALRKFLAHRFQNTPWEELSMGTSSDFEIAIQEGATIIRIGQAILGARPEKGQSDFQAHAGV